MLLFPESNSNSNILGPIHSSQARCKKNHHLFTYMVFKLLVAGDPPQDQGQPRYVLLLTYQRTNDFQHHLQTRFIKRSQASPRWFLFFFSIYIVELPNPFCRIIFYVSSLYLWFEFDGHGHRRHQEILIYLQNYNDLCASSTLWSSLSDWEHELACLPHRRVQPGYICTWSLFEKKIQSMGCFLAEYHACGWWRCLRGRNELDFCWFID